MIKAAEKKRIDLVHKFNNLNFDHDHELQDIVKLATQICRVPIAMITLMGKDEQLIKIQIGTNIKSVCREDTFCQHLIGTEEVLVVPDTLKDKRFANSPLVQGECNIRFYAGSPLITLSDHHLGSLCVFDQIVHQMSEQQEEMLAILSRQVMNLLELKMSVKVIEEQRERLSISEHTFRTFFNSSASCHILIDKKYKILAFNKSIHQFIHQVKQKNILTGKNILDYVSESNKPEFIKFYKLALSGKASKRDIKIQHTDNKSIWWNISFVPVRDDEGNIISVSYNGTNINESKMQMDEIFVQNESLKNIAYIQSHEYRRPVASIMGIMNIIKEENYNPEKECLLMMETAVNELDQKIKQVISCSEKALG